MKNSIKKNFIYNSLMLIFNIGFPLITAPYVSRVLGVAQIGEINFASSFVNWFVLLSSLGFTTYGIREIARIREDRERLNKVFSEILSLNMLSVIVFLTIYYFIILTIPKFQANNKLMIIYSLNLILSFLSLDWFYYGIENYEYISKRSLIFKIISIILLFNFVKTESDFYNYVIILILGVGASNVLNLLNSKKYVSFKFRFNVNHIILAKIFYFQVILGSIYSVLDQVLLGIFSTNIQVGYYSRARQLTMLVITIVLCFVRTITPRLSNLYINDKAKYEDMVNTSFKITSFLVFPSMVGIMFLSKNIMYLFGGNEFIGASNSLKVLSLLLVFTVYSTFIDTHISLPSGNEKNTFYGNIGVALVSLIFNLLLLKKYGAIGAAISICIGEAIGMIIQIYLINKKKLYVKFYNKSILKYIISSFFMGVILHFFVRNKNENLILNMLIFIVFGGIVYFISIYLTSKILVSEENEIVIILKKLRRN